ncbi:hypothetical protein BC829DRAFT_425115 [Chytridium lagenaria]|nr:hypothetical protein BC829DRAFT_425115 [Chytridium lagenaria]
MEQYWGSVKEEGYHKEINLNPCTAISSALLVAPFISIIDKAIFANASGVQPLGAGITTGFKTLFTKPVYFAKQPAFLLIWASMLELMSSQNSIEAVCNHMDANPFYPKFVGASFANVSLSVLKDLYFTPPPAPVRTVPFRSYSLYTIRDSMTIFASFNMPQMISGYLAAHWSVKPKNAEFAAQLVTPCAVQLASTPLHLLGMDYYNSPGATVEYIGTTLARMGRIFPAYGIGGVVNKQLRSKGKEYLNERHSI